MVRMRVALVITRRKPGRDYAYPHIKESLTSLLVGHGCPLAISEVNNYWRVEGAMVQLLEWFGGGEYDRMALMGRYVGFSQIQTPSLILVLQEFAC